MERSVADVRRRDVQREEMIPLLERHKIQVLLDAGHSQRDVHARTGASIKTVRRVRREMPVQHVDDRAEVKRRKIGRPSKAEPYRAFVTKLVTEAPALLSVEILRRAKDEGYKGSKTALYALIAGLRPPAQKPIVRFEGVAGEFSQHDFGEVNVRFLDGTTKHIHFFGSRLKYSRWVQVTIVENERVESLVRSLVSHFEAMGGVPLLAVFDRPKTIAVRWAKDGSVTEWNGTFAQVMLELGVGVELCWPRSGNQKGSVERLVGWVKGSFFKQRRFVNEQDLREQLAQWHTEVNEQTVSRATGVTPTSRMVEERSRLRPVKVSSEDLALRIPVYVGPTGVVSYDGHTYSMPTEAMMMPATLFLYRERVRIVAGRHEVSHPRLLERGARSILPEHRSQMLAAVSGKRAKRYYKREQILGLGREVLEYLTELVHRRQRTWSQDVNDMFDMLQEHGPDALKHAVGLALSERTFGAEYVAHFLSAPRPERLRSGRGAQPRGAGRGQLDLRLGRAEPDEGGGDR